MVFNLITRFRMHGNDGNATAILDLHFEGDADTRQLLEHAIRAALAPQEEAIEEKVSRLGFDLAHGEE